MYFKSKALAEDHPDPSRYDTYTYIFESLCFVINICTYIYVYCQWLLPVDTGFTSSFVSFTPLHLALSVFGQGRAPRNHAAAVPLLNFKRNTNSLKFFMLKFNFAELTLGSRDWLEFLS